MKYTTRITRLTVAPEGEAVFSEQATDIEIDDEADGEYIAIHQERADDDLKHTLRFDRAEWPHIVAAVERLIKEML